MIPAAEISQEPERPRSGDTRGAGDAYSVRHDGRRKAMGKITISKLIAAPVESVFAYVDDYRNTTKYMKDLTKWKPTGERTHGKGAEFEVGMRAGPSTLSSTVHINTWAENKVIGWTSRSGFKQNGRWTFKAKGEETEATFEMEYEFGGGIAGRMLGRAAEPIVRVNLERSVGTLKEQMERQRPKAKAGARGGASSPKAASSSGSKKSAPATRGSSASRGKR
jgi:uncharacterized membrane protein